jgi:hypothetical protein
MQGSDVDHVNLQGILLFLEVGIIMSVFFIFHVSLSESGVVNSMDLSFLGTYIPTCHMLT